MPPRGTRRDLDRPAQPNRLIEFTDRLDGEGRDSGVEFDNASMTLVPRPAIRHVPHIEPVRLLMQSASALSVIGVCANRSSTTGDLTMASLASASAEVFFPDGEIIVSKTDLKGRLTYVNRTFCNISGYTESELLGQPHNIIRHPEMPRAVFKLLWDTLAEQKEIFAYVANATKNGGFYWVLAHVTPSRDQDGKIVGYHSNRRPPRREVVSDVIVPLYARVLEAERSETNGQKALRAGTEIFQEMLKSRSTSYDAFIFSL